MQKSSPLCPHCDTAMEIVEIVAPEDEVRKTQETVAAGGFGAVAGGVLGSVAGPGGAAIGATIGAGVLSTSAASKDEVRARCPRCGSEERRTFPQGQAPNRRKHN